DLRLLVLGPLRPRRVQRHGGRRRDRNRVLRAHVEPLAEGRDRRRLDALREALVVDVGDVVDDEAVGAAGGVEVLAAQLQRADVVAAMRVDLGELAAALLEAREALRVRDGVERAAARGLLLRAP